MSFRPTRGEMPACRSISTMRRTSPIGAKSASRGIPPLSFPCKGIPRRSFLPPRDDVRKGSLAISHKNATHFCGIFAGEARMGARSLAQGRFPSASAPHLRIPALMRKGECAGAINVANCPRRGKPAVSRKACQRVFFSLTRFYASVRGKTCEPVIISPQAKPRFCAAGLNVPILRLTGVKSALCASARCAVRAL